MRKLLKLIFVFLCLNLATSARVSVLESDNSIDFKLNLKFNKIQKNGFELLNFEGASQIFADTIGKQVLFPVKYSFAFAKNDSPQLITPIEDFYKVELRKVQNCIDFDRYELTLYPYQKKSLSFVSLVNLKISFKEQIDAKTKEHTYPQFSFYTNPKKLSALLSKKQSKSNRIASSDWYDPNKTYFKVETSQDKIYKVALSDFGLNSNQNNIQNLHCIYLGNSYPFYIKSNDNFLDNTDTIFFLGSHPKGDTTYFDNYASFESFFFYYDSEKVNTNQLAINGLVSSNSATSIQVNRHLEYEKHYSYVGPITTETYQTEGWYEKELNPFAGQTDTASKNFIFNSLNNLTDSVKLTIRLAATNEPRDGLPSYSEHYIKLNGEIIDKQSIKFPEIKTYNYIFPANKFENGLNNITIESLGRDFVKDTIFEVLAVDYQELSGKEEAIAENDQLNLNPNNSQDLKIEVSNFASSKVYSISNDRKSIEIANLTKVDLATSSAKENYLQARLNNYAKNYIGSGYLIIAGSNDNYSYYAGNVDTDAEKFINQNANADYFSFCFNKKSAIPNGIKSNLSTIGATSINSVNLNDYYCFAKIKNDYSESINQQKASINNKPKLSNGLMYVGSISIAANTYDLVLNGENSIPLLKALSQEKTSYSKDIDSSDVIVLTHKSFKNSALDYINYRKKTSPQFKYKLIDVDDLYKEFNYGRKSPHAIKSYLKFAYDNYKNKIKYAVIWGDASSDSRMLSDGAVSIDYVPTYGYPVSDTWYGLLNLEAADTSSYLIIGRVPIYTPEQGFEYLEKLKEFDNAPKAKWQKKYFSMSTGYDVNENQYFYLQGRSLMDYFLRNGFCGDTVSVRRGSTTPTGVEEAGVIRNFINEGAIWTSYIGHGSQSQFEMDGWDVSTLNNKGKYGILTTISCNTAAFATPPTPSGRNEDYVIRPNKGFIASVGPTATSTVNQGMLVQSFSLEALTGISSKVRNLGEIYAIGKSAFIETSTMYQINLLGDPLVNLPIDTIPELYFDDKFTLTNEKGEDTFTEDDQQVNLKMNILNSGMNPNEIFKVKFIHNYGTKQDSTTIEINNLCGNEQVQTQFSIAEQVGEHYIDAIIDYENELTESNKTNNTVRIRFDSFRRGLLPLEPFDYWNKSSNNPKFRVINPNPKEGTTYSFEIKKGSSIVKSSLPNEIIINENYIEWQPLVQLETNTNYNFLANYKENNVTNNKTLELNFNTKSYDDLNEALISLNASNNAITNLEQMSLDSINKYGLTEVSHKFNILSLACCSPRTSNAWNNIEVVPDNDITKTNVFVNEFRGGFNIVKYNLSDLNQQPEYRWYPTHYLAYFPENDKSAFTSTKLVRYLRDTVKENELIMVSVSSGYMGIMEWNAWGDTLGNIAAVRNTFKWFYNSQFADSLISGGSWAFIGQKGKKPLAEKFIMFDSASISGEFLRYYQKGSLATKSISLIDSIKSIEVKNIDTSLYNYKLKLIGMNNSQENEIDSAENQSLTYTNWKKISNEQIKVKLEIAMKEEKSKHLDNEIHEINILAKTKPDIALVKSKSKYLLDTLERGYEQSYSANFENISLRGIAQNVAFETKFNNDDLLRTYSKAQINPNQSYNFDTTFNTSSFPNKNSVTTNLTSNYSQFNDIYRFNNSSSSTFALLNDTTKPIIKFYFDDRLIADRDFVSQKPRIRIELHDASPIPSTDTNSLRIRLNRVIQNKQNTDSLSVSLVNKNELKSVLYLEPKENVLEFGENLLTIYGRDESGNFADTVDIYVLVEKNGSLKELVIYPNPVKDMLNFKAKFIANKNEVKATIRMYDLTGNKFEEKPLKFNIGDNTFSFPATNFNGVSLPTGVYLFKIDFEDEFFVEPVIGKFIKME